MALYVWASPQTWWNSLISGNILGSVLLPFTDALGGWFYVLMTLTAMMMVYLKWNDYNSTAMVGFIIISGLLPFIYGMEGIQSALPVIYLAITLAIGTILYKALYK